MQVEPSEFFIDDMTAENLYYKMLLIREAEKAIIDEYPTDEIKTPCHLAIGAEAIAVALCHSFPEAKIFTSYRNHHWYLACGGSLNDFFLELYGKQNDIADGKAGSMHLNAPKEGLMLTSAVVATQIAPALGFAFAESYKKAKTLTIVALGDGATEEGAFHECLNLASLYQLPILFVVEDNDLAIHQTKDTRQAFRLADLVQAYSIDYYSTQGSSLDKLLSWGKEIKKFPAVLHVDYHRFLEHVGINQDYNAGYRAKPLIEDKLDPIKLLPLQECIRTLTRENREQISERVHSEIKRALILAKNAPLAPIESLVEHVFAS